MLAWIPAADARVFEVTGKDARDFLHRMLTQDVKGIPAMSGRPALFLTVRGRVVGDPFVWNLGDRFALAFDAKAAELTIPALERYVIADDVTFRDATSEWADGLVAGSGQLAPIVGVLVATHGLGEATVRRVLARPTAESALEEAFRTLDASELEGATLNGWRVDFGVPAFGAEIDDRILPNEAGLDSSISWTKGCYLGQEPVVMAKHRGHPPSRLVRLEIAGNDVPERDAVLSDATKPVGRITTATRTADGNRVRAMGFVRWDLAVAGKSLSLEGRPATITAALA